MNLKIIKVLTFKVESSFAEWSVIFDSEDADRRHSEFDIKPIFRGFNKDDPKKVIFLLLAPEGNIQKFIEANSKWIESHAVVFQP